MATKADLQDFVLEALRTLGGSGNVVDVSRTVWNQHEDELRASGDLFFTWQYDLRWAAQKLRYSGKLAPTTKGAGSQWRLAR